MLSLSLHSGGSTSTPSICYLLNSGTITLPFKITCKGRQGEDCTSGRCIDASTLPFLAVALQTPQADHTLCAVPNLHLMPTGLGCTYFPYRPCFSGGCCKDKVLQMIPGYERGLWLWNLNLYETQSTEAHALRLQKASKETKQTYTYIYINMLNSIINT